VLNNPVVLQKLEEKMADLEQQRLDLMSSVVEEPVVFDRD